jgi:integrase
MTSLRVRGDTYHAIFRVEGRQYERSLKTNDRRDAEFVVHGIERMLHRLRTGQEKIPPGFDPGDYVIGGGRLPSAGARPRVPTVGKAKDLYLAAQQNRISDSHLGLQRTHLTQFCQFLGAIDPLRCDRVSSKKVDAFLQQRLRERDPVTVRHVRNTLLRFFQWAVSQGYVEKSPVATLEPIRAGRDMPPFRTIAEIEAIIERGGLDDDGTRELWKCLYLSPREIAELLQTVRQNACYDASFMLHCIPAYTGMRRGEVLRLRWTDVDFGQGYITARSRKQSRTKRETARRIDLHQGLRRELEKWREQRPKAQDVMCDAETLEPLGKDKANRCFWQPMRGTEWCLESNKNWFKVGFHTYRHSFASNLAAAGVDQRIIDEFMGHTMKEFARVRRSLPRGRPSSYTGKDAKNYEEYIRLMFELIAVANEIPEDRRRREFLYAMHGLSAGTTEWPAGCCAQASRNSSCFSTPSRKVISARRTDATSPSRRQKTVVLGTTLEVVSWTAPLRNDASVV